MVMVSQASKVQGFWQDTSKADHAGAVRHCSCQTPQLSQQQRQKGEGAHGIPPLQAQVHQTSVALAAAPAAVTLPKQAQQACHAAIPVPPPVHYAQKTQHRASRAAQGVVARGVARHWGGLGAPVAFAPLPLLPLV